MAGVKLHGAWYSPFSTRVEMVLKLKGVEYEYVEEDLRNKSEALLKINPIYKKIPVLLHNGNSIVESMIIVEYIDEAFPGPSILPKDPYERYQARFWAKFIDEKCISTLWKACWTKGEEGEKTKEEATEALKHLETEIKGKKFFGGDNFGVLDIVASFVAHWFRILEELLELQLLTEDKFPHLCRWADECCNHSFFKDNLPPKDRLVASFKTVMETGKFTY